MWIFFFSKFGEFGPLFPWKILCIIGRNHIFQVEFLRKFANKKYTAQKSTKSGHSEPAPSTSAPSTGCPLLLVVAEPELG
jgi:hypothetical protein